MNTSKQQRLDTDWRLARDGANRGRAGRWFEKIQSGAKPAPVPGIIQQVFPGYCGVAWYWVRFDLLCRLGPHERALLRFGAVDYLAEIWLNGRPVGGHEGGETPFTLDVTAALRPRGANLLAVRVLNPTHEPVDGIRLMETPHSQKGVAAVGAAFNTGGIVLPVDLLTAPAARVTDVFAAPDIRTGRVRLRISLQNELGAPVRGHLRAAVSLDKDADVVAESQEPVRLPPGHRACVVPVVVREPRLWSLEDPVLYRVRAELTVAQRGEPIRHEYSVRFGFRDFRVRKGFFHLNGRRIFLRSMHTVPFFPAVQLGAPDPDLMRRDLLYAKACGFNCVRFLSKMPLPEQLDLADEIGLMIYEEPYAAWWSLKEEEITDRRKVATRFRSAVREMILRDRNHPSVVIWGLLNEVFRGPIFPLALKALPLVREADETRLVLLSSGRMDLQPTTGSLCNPGSRRWETEWGAEGKGARPAKAIQTPEHLNTAGDIHYYPPYPISAESRAMLRRFGARARPVFLSEGGIGSALNAIAELRRYEERPALRADLEDRVFFRAIVEDFQKDWQRFKMDGVYPFPEDMLRDSQRVHASQRRQWFDLVRSNPNLCGHSLTSMLDGTSGEGIWTFWREFKPGIVDVMRDGWAPLRWCLFVTPLHGYAGRPMEVEAVLANEDVLAPGTYPVTFRIWGRHGVVWERRVTLRLPAGGKGGLPPLAVPVLKTTLRLKAPPGEYTFAACLERGGAAAGDRRPFRLSAVEDLPRSPGEVCAVGLAPETLRWLARRNVRARSALKANPPAREVILVGSPSGGFDTWRALLRRAARGAYVAFLEAEPFLTPQRLPLRNKGRCCRIFDWLYHKEAVARNHPLFDGLPSPGILDWDDYDELAGQYLFDGGDVPDDTIVAGFASGLNHVCVWRDQRFYLGGMLVGEYAFGAGRFLLSGLPILSNLDRHPAADRLFLNLIAHARIRTAGKTSCPPADLEARIRRIYPDSPPDLEVRPAGDGRLLLTATRAMLESRAQDPLRLHPHPDGTPQIGNWSDPKGKATWWVCLPRPGRYRVVVQQACAPEAAGSSYRLRVGAARLRGVVRPTRGWYDFAEVALGTAALPAGCSTLELTSLKLKKNAFMDIRAILLDPQS
jgi:hypothetical protein